MLRPCVCYHSQLAAKRYCLYWEKRLEVCGPDKAFLPMTLDGAVRDDTAALEIGFFNYMAGHADSQGRGILYLEPGKQDRTKYSRESMIRAVWYHLHAALEQTECQKHGILFVSYPGGAKLGQFDRTLIKALLGSMQGVLPVRVSAIHICQPPAFIKIILPVVRLFMSDRVKRRLCLHFGSAATVREKLQAATGLTDADIPAALGGHAVIDSAAWIAARRAEGK